MSYTTKYFVRETLTDSLPTDDLGLLGESSLPPCVYHPIKRIRSNLLGEHGSQAIREGIGVLEKLGILEKWDNSENGQDKTWQYKIDTDVLEQLLKQAKFRGKC